MKNNFLKIQRKDGRRAICKHAKCSDKEKAHAGLSIIYTLDRRNNKIFPSWGCYLNVSVLGLEGLNQYSKGFIQVVPEATMYKALNARSTIIFSNRLGGGITIGQKRILPISVSWWT